MRALVIARQTLESRLGFTVVEAGDVGEAMDRLGWAGPCGFLSKPFRIEELARAVRGVLGSARPPAQSAPAWKHGRRRAAPDLAGLRPDLPRRSLLPQAMRPRRAALVRPSAGSSV